MSPGGLGGAVTGVAVTVVRDANLLQLCRGPIDCDNELAALEAVGCREVDDEDDDGGGGGVGLATTVDDVIAVNGSVAFGKSVLSNETDLCTGIRTD
jgi:hypothetical protein